MLVLILRQHNTGSVFAARWLRSQPVPQHESLQFGFSDLRQVTITRSMSPSRRHAQRTMATTSNSQHTNSVKDELHIVSNSSQMISFSKQSSSALLGSRTAVRDLSSTRDVRSKTSTSRNDHLREQKTVPSPASGGVPTPSAAYLATCNIGAQRLIHPQHLLVVVDLNGTLLYRPSRRQPTRFIARPHTLRFLKYCIDTFTVVIWSSARPENVAHMCEAILTSEMREKVAAIWGRERFDLTSEDYSLRVQCYKRLTKIWADRTIAATHPGYELGHRWDQTNTVLVDDSLEKGRSEPFNIIEIPEFHGDRHESGDILPQVHDFLNHLSMHSNVSACLRTRPLVAR